MAWILGISAYFHDSAAALVRDGNVVAAAAEERFSRRKHDDRFPRGAIQACLCDAGVSVSDVAQVVFYEKPLLKFDRWLESHLAHAPRGYAAFARGMPGWLDSKLRMPMRIRRELGNEFRGTIQFAEHHHSHAAGAFFTSPMDEAAVLTIDAVGEWATTSWGIGDCDGLRMQQVIRFPHSLGMLYSTITDHCGFRVGSGESKLMGLAAYGRPTMGNLIREHLIQIHEDGSFRLNLKYFDYCHRLRMAGPALATLLGVSRRGPDQRIEQGHMDLAASIQDVTQEVVMKLARHVHARTGLSKLCMAGGVALNCVANGELRRDGPFDEIWIQPAAGDAGGAAGAALWGWHRSAGGNRSRGTAKSTRPTPAMAAVFLGPSIELSDLDDDVDGAEVVLDEPAVSIVELADTVARMIAAGSVVGLAQGRMEYGPRALGNRSILADPRDPAMRDRLNDHIKHRESFRPFAPVVLQDRAGEIFEMPTNRTVHAESPLMQFTFSVRAEQRDAFPAITHVDGSARVQTVNDSQNPLLAAILRAFARRTGCPMLVNTSLNVRGEPIACTAMDAVKCFLRTGIDALVLGDRVARRDRQPPSLLEKYAWTAELFESD